MRSFTGARPRRRNILLTQVAEWMLDDQPRPLAELKECFANPEARGGWVNGDRLLAEFESEVPLTENQATPPTTLDDDQHDDTECLTVGHLECDGNVNYVKLCHVLQR